MWPLNENEFDSSALEEQFTERQIRRYGRKLKTNHREQKESLMWSYYPELYSEGGNYTVEIKYTTSNILCCDTEFCLVVFLVLNKTTNDFSDGCKRKDLKWYDI